MRKLLTILMVAVLATSASAAGVWYDFSAGDSFAGTDASQANRDVNGDGVVDAADQALIVRDTEGGWNFLTETVEATPIDQDEILFVGSEFFSDVALSSSAETFKMQAKFDDENLGAFSAFNGVESVANAKQVLTYYGGGQLGVHDGWQTGLSYEGKWNTPGETDELNQMYKVQHILRPRPEGGVEVEARSLFYDDETGERYWKYAQSGETFAGDSMPSEFGDLTLVGRADPTGDTYADGASDSSWQMGFTEFAAGTTLQADFNLDGEVGLSDFAALGQNFGTSEGATLWTGDASNDGAVDLTDFAALGQSFGSSAAAQAAAETGEMDLIVDVTTGEAWLDIGEDVTTTGYQIKSADGDLLPDEFTGGLEGLDVPPAGNTETSIAQFALSSVDAPAGELSLGGIFDESGDGTDLTFSWTDGDFNESSGNVVIIPEPATMALLGLGGLAAVIRRKRS